MEPRKVARDRLADAYNGSAMPSVDAALVDIVREFFSAHRLLVRLFERYGAGELRFSELEDLVGDDERAVLYRLKERCHSLFRAGGGSNPVAVHRGALFDLAVGSLFHEAMSFRESFYQREVYGPRMRALRDAAAAEADALFQEFEKILAGLSGRLQEGLRETEALLNQTREQLRRLLTEQRESGQLARCLLEHREDAEAVFARGLDELLSEIHGCTAAGYALAGRSYLASGYYEEADRALGDAIGRGGEEGVLRPLCEYARGMLAYLAGDYPESVERLGRWAASDSDGETALRSLAHAAVTRIRKFSRSDGREELSSAAAALSVRLAPPVRT